MPHRFSLLCAILRLCTINLAVITSVIINVQSFHVDNYLKQLVKKKKMSPSMAYYCTDVWRSELVSNFTFYVSSSILTTVTYSPLLKFQVHLFIRN